MARLWRAYLDGLGRKRFKIAPKSAILATLVAWARNDSKWHRNHSLLPLRRPQPEMIQNGFEIFHLSKLGGLGLFVMLACSYQFLSVFLILGGGERKEKARYQFLYRF